MVTYLLLSLLELLGFEWLNTGVIVPLDFLDTLLVALFLSALLEPATDYGAYSLLLP